MRKKIIILGTIAVGAIITAIVVPVVLLNNKEVETKKDNVIYADKLKTLKIKEVTISETSGTITQNKASIKTQIKALADFPKLPDGITWEVKDDSTILTTNEVPIILVVKKEGETNIEIIGFSVKRSQSDEEILNDFADKLTAFAIKEVTISATSGSITDNKASIKTKIQALVSDFPSLPDGLTWEVKEATTVITTSGVEIILVLTKDSTTKEVLGFSVKRSKTDKESVDAYAAKLIAFATKEVTISETSGTITQNKASIKTQIKALANFPPLPTGITWEVKGDPAVLTTDGVPITLVVKKGLIEKEVQRFNVKRSKTDEESVDAYANKLIAFATKEVTISETSGIITDNKDSIKDQIKALADFPPAPTGITWEVKDDSTILTTSGVPITLVVKSGQRTKEVSGFSVKISKSDQESVNAYIAKLNALPLSIKKIEIETSGTITDNKKLIEDQIKTFQTEGDNFPPPPAGITLQVKETNTLITFNWVEITLVVTKGLVTEEVSGFRIKKVDLDKQLVFYYAQKLIAFVTKEVTISETSGTITQNKASIKTQIKALDDFRSFSDGVTWEVKDDSTILTTSGVPITLVVKRGQRTEEVQGFSVKRSKTDKESVDAYAAKLIAFATKEVTIDETSGTITERKASIKTKIEDLANFPPLPNGITWEVKEEDTILTTTTTPITLVVKKGLIEKEVQIFNVKRSKTDEESVDAYADKLKTLKIKEVTIIETSGTITDNKASIENKIWNLNDVPLLPNGITWEVKGDSKILTTTATPITLVVKKGLIEKEVQGFSVKRSV